MMCFASVAKESMERWLPVIAQLATVHVQWSGSTLTVWGSAFAPEGEWIWPLCIGFYAQLMILTKNVLLMAIFAKN